MQAVRLIEARRLEQVDLPPPRRSEGEVVLRVEACGICGSDLSCYKHGIFAGAVLGHEIVGAIEASDDPSWPAGTRAVVDPKFPCGGCLECARGTSHRCIAALTQGVGQTRQGGFAEQLAVPTSHLYRVPDTLSFQTAALAEPLAVALHGLRLAGTHAGSAVVIGLGPIGLLAVAALRARNASPVIGVDPVRLRRDLALDLGADLACEPGDSRIAEVQPTVVVEASGHPAAIADAGNAAAPGARVVLLGIPIGEATIWPMTWITREITVIGSVAQEARDFAEALELLARVPAIGEMVTRTVGLAEVPDAFASLVAHPDAGKILVTPNDV
ncbi:MAG TPA: alcohol dehydrogenase catalytic domain-containing protein [Actinomycetota bacterium]